MLPGEPVEKLNVVILYDCMTSVGRAMAAFGHLVRELGNEFAPELRIWRIDAATLPECAAEADGDIQAAEMVILAIHGNHRSHEPFLRRVEETCGRPSLPKRALIAIIEAADDFARSAGTWNRVLVGGAGQIPPDVFLWATPKGTELDDAVPELCPVS